MKKEWRVERLTGGMALALLIVATVVGTARADDNICTQCTNYWQNRCGLDKACVAYPQQSYQYQQCCWNYVQQHCVGPGLPCTVMGEMSHTAVDCSAFECNAYPDIPGASVCSEKCWNRSCSAENQCLDRQKQCNPNKDPSYKCIECRCNPNP